MKRLTSFVLMFAMVIGMHPTAHAAGGWQAVARQCEELGFSVTWYPEYEGLMRRYGTDRMLLVKEGQSYLYTLDGKQCLAGPFDAFGEFNKAGHAPACKNGKWGMVNMNGNAVVDFVYDGQYEAETADKSYPAFKGKDGKNEPPYALVKEDGALLTGYDFWEVGNFVNGFARVTNGEGYGYIDVTGRRITPYIYSNESKNFSADGYAVVHEYSIGYNVINADGEKLLPETWAPFHRHPWDAGFGIWGYVSNYDGIVLVNIETGERVSEKTFENAFDSGKSWPCGYQFNSDGIMSVVLREDGELRYYLLDIEGNLTAVERENGGGLPVDPATGKTYFPSHGPEPRQKEDEDREGLVWINAEGSDEGLGYDHGIPWGFADENGELIVPAIFDAVGYFDHGYASVMADGVFGLLHNPLKKNPSTGEEKPNGPETPDISFTDVPAGSWFEQGVMTCARNGIMVGTGENTFSPHTQLTNAECLVLAMRLYDLQRGGNGSLEKMPADQGKIVLTTSDGKVYSNHGENAWEMTFPSGGHNYRTNYTFVVVLSHSAGEYMTTPEPDEPELGPATVAVNGTTIAGRVDVHVDPDGRRVLGFTAEEPAGGELGAALNTPTPDQWWRDAVYTAHQWGLEKKMGIRAFLEFPESGRYLTSRWNFALALFETAGDLPKINRNVTIPDMTREQGEVAYQLYEAGILNGVDETGTFDPYGKLTRAEAAVMVARILDEGQRLKTD